jgi:hypothetical protein
MLDKTPMDSRQHFLNMFWAAFYAFLTGYAVCLAFALALSWQEEGQVLHLRTYLLAIIPAATLTIFFWQPFMMIWEPSQHERQDET